MIEIDGSYGEGGGQILRTAVSLSAFTLKTVRIYNIRSGRPKPGLKRQHIAGIELTGHLVNAEISGLHEGSTEVIFQPRERRGGLFKYDIRTAGAISLVLQAVLPAAILAPDKITLQIKGGTDVSWSPPIDYMREVFIPAITRLGAQVTIKQLRRGHYPRGGGEVTCEVNPVDRITPFKENTFGEIEYVRGISHCVRLPAHVAERQAKAAESTLRARGFEPIKIEVEHYPKENDPHRGPGSGIVLWAESDRGNRIGADALGTRGKSAESVGKEAANNLSQQIKTGMPVDAHLADMLVPYLALAPGESKIGVTEITSHLETNIWVTERFLRIKTRLTRNNDGSGTLVISNQASGSIR
ncbi:MAG: RNA 3'-terminal phosphate cyclase [Candidatus Thorarchaeota archaeon]|nr:RNA 3'-terminal phosphate cyclase [Candidatus Thorarchaeota archaeon]